MGRIAFVTDSTACLTPEQVNEYDIHVVPLSVIFGDQTYEEGSDLTAAEFYQKLSAERTMPTTSQPSIGAFTSLFEGLLETHDAVLCLLLSGKVSGTVHTAESAARAVGGDITVIDSKIASYGIAGPLIDGIELYRNGGTKEDVLSLWEQELKEVHAYFVVDSLEQLHRGGRIGGAAAVFGSILQIKPILTMIDGRIDLFEKVRTHRRAMERMLAEFDAFARSGATVQVGVIHAQRLADAEQLRDQLQAQYPNIRAVISELGPVIGTHLGSGVLALVYYERVNRHAD